MSDSEINSSFQINDVILDIPPENIRIERFAQVKQYKPMRTRGSAKVRSSSSVTSITVQCKFVGIEDINYKLRALVAQFRLTPFCYVRNNFISNNLLGNEIRKDDSQEHENIAFALNNMTISTVEGLPDTWNVMFSFIWFNYKPYTKRFRFKSSLFGTTVANNLEGPHALGTGYTPFNDFYASELKKLKPITLESSDLNLDILEFQVFTSTPANTEVPPSEEISLAQLTEFENSAISLISDISDISSGPTDNEDLLMTDLSKTENLEKILNSLNNSIQDIKKKNPNKTDIINALTQQQNKLLLLAPSIVGRRNWILYPTLDKKDMTKATSSTETKTANLYYRVKSFSTTGTDFESGSVVTNISINFNHKLAIIPMQGYSYPTVQHLGSDDMTMTMSISCLDESSSKELADFWIACQNSIHFTKKIPQELTSVHVQNELFQFVGVDTVLITSKADSTVQNQPGLYAYELEAIENVFNISQTEGFSVVAFTNQKVRELIWKAIFSNIRVDNLKRRRALEVNRFLIRSAPGLDASSKSLLDKIINLDIVNDTAFGLDNQLTSLFEKLKDNSILLDNKKFTSFDLIGTLKDNDVLGATFINDILKNLLISEGPEVVDEQITRGNTADNTSLRLKSREESKRRLESLRIFNRQIKEQTNLRGTIKKIDSSLLITFQDNTTLDLNTIIFDEKIKEEIRNTTVKNVLTKSNVALPLGNEEQLNEISFSAVKIQVEKELNSLELTIGQGIDPFLSLFSEWELYATRTADEIVDKYLSGEFAPTLFAEAKQEYEKGKLKQKRSLYRDMDFETIESVIKNNYSIPDEIRLEPDFYFWNESVDENKISSIDKTASDKIIQDTLKYLDQTNSNNNTWYTKTYKNKVDRSMQEFLEAAHSGEEGFKLVPLIDDLQPGSALSQMKKLPAANQTADQSIESASVNNTNAKPYTNFFPKNLKNNSVFTDKRTNTNLPRGLESIEDRLHFNTTIHAQPSGPIDSITQSVSDSIQDPEIKYAMGDWASPLPRGYHVTSTPGFRTLAGLGSGNHKGTDLAILKYIGPSLGQPVYSIKAGTVIYNAVSDGGGNGIWIRTNVELPGIKTITHKYYHLLAPALPQVGSKVATGEMIAFLGNTGQRTTGPHLHLELETDTGQIVYPFDYNAEEVIAANPTYRHLDLIKIGKASQPYLPGAGLGDNADSTIFDLATQQLQASWNREAGYRMGRAYPSVQMSFVEEDTLDQRIMRFDDYFDFSSIVSLSMVRDREVPADYVQMELTNLSGILSNRKFKGTPDSENPISNGKEAKDASRENPDVIDTDQEHKFDSLLLRDGMKVEIKMGYSNDPDKLELIFVGRITSVEFSESDDVVMLELQSFATELAQDIKGAQPVEITSTFKSVAETGTLLEDLISSPECIGFGFWKRGIRDKNTNRDLLTNRFTWNPQPSSDNIFAPSSFQLDPRMTFFGKSLITKALFAAVTAGALAAGTGLALSAGLPAAILIGVSGTFGGSAALVGAGALFQKINRELNPSDSEKDSEIIKAFKEGIFSGLSYWLIQTTIWEVFKEMEHRHPECIGSPVPYIERAGARSRMTMFFGNPDWWYFANDPSGDLTVKTQELLDRGNRLKKAIKARSKEDMKKTLQDFSDTISFDPGRTFELKTIQDSLNSEIKDSEVSDRIDSIIEKERLEIALAEGSIRPFRRYHIVTSQQHIVANNIQVNVSKMFNTVTIQYADGKSDLTKEKEEVTIDSPESITMKLDPLIPDEYVREATYTYPNCQGDEMAKRYAISHLQKSCWNIYQGDLVILGNPSIKPYDIVYVADEYSDMYGPIQVKRVTHIFDYESGFITIITPDLLTTVSEGAALCNSHAMGLMAEHFLSAEGIIDFDKEGEAEILSPLKYMGSKALLRIGSLFGMKKLLFITQFGHPVRIHPLIHQGQPMIAGFAPAGVRQNEFIINDLFQWIETRSKAVSQSFEDFNRMWDNRQGVLNTRGSIFGGDKNNK